MWQYHLDVTKNCFVLFSKADADLQLAVALSESINQENTATKSEAKTNEDVQNAGTNNAFSVLMTPKLHKHTKRRTKYCTPIYLPYQS